MNTRTTIIDAKIIFHQCTPDILHTTRCTIVRVLIDINDDTVAIAQLSTRYPRNGCFVGMADIVAYNVFVSFYRIAIERCLNTDTAAAVHHVPSIIIDEIVLNRRVIGLNGTDATAREVVNNTIANDDMVRKPRFSIRSTN